MPAGFSAVAGSTGIGYTNRGMIWVGSLIVRSDMAVAAYGCRSCIAVCVAKAAFYGIMGPCQRE